MRRDTTSKREWSADVCSSDLLPATTPTSSVTAPVATPPSTGVSLVPWMVTVTSWLAVPSEDTAVKLSVRSEERRVGKEGGWRSAAVEGKVTCASSGEGAERWR